MEETTRIYWAKRERERILSLRSLDWARKLLQGNRVVYLPHEALVHVLDKETQTDSFDGRIDSSYLAFG